MPRPSEIGRLAAIFMRARLFCLPILLIAVFSAVPAQAQDITLAYTATNTEVGGTTLADNAVLNLTLGSTINALGGYDITHISGNVGGDVITGLIPLDGPSTYSIFPNGFDALGTDLVLGDTYYTNGGPLLDIGGVGFMSATNYYNLYFNDGSPYQLMAFSIQEQQTLPQGSQGPSFSLSDGTLRAVPEPATWVMMLLGFGAIGLIIRRRMTSIPTTA